MDELQGCTNHGCLVAPLRKAAIGTNAICQCMRNPVTAQRVAYDRLKLMDENARLREALSKVVMHTARPPFATPELLNGLLDSCERIAGAALEPKL